MLHQFDINLDLPPKQRWVEVVTYFKKDCLLTLEYMEKLTTGTFVGKCLNMLVSGIAATYIKTGNVMYKEELESIANILGVSCHKVLLSQLIYELNSACTSVVLNHKGKNVMFRTMDWDLELLKKLTCELKFTKNNKTIFKAVSWGGYIGILTALVPKKYSLAVNYRRSSNGTLLTSLKRIIGLAWPVGYLCRHLLEKELDYDIIKQQLIECNLVSPCYFILCNHQSTSHKIIRDCDTCVDSIKTDQYLIQTNKDPGITQTNILFSCERELLAEKIILENKEKWDDYLSIFNSFLINPIINEETVYASMMVPEDETLFCMVNNY